MKTKVVNIRTEQYFDVYIGRPSAFGNPFVVGQHGGREHCVEEYKYFFLRRMNDTPGFKEKVISLRGKVLGCYCKPKACHGDIIVEYLEGT